MHRLKYIARRAAQRPATTPTSRWLHATAASASSEAEVAFRRFGHMEASLDPLGLASRPPRPELAAHASHPDADRLRATYCGFLGVEFEHLEAAEERDWFAGQLAALAPEDGGFQLTTAQKRNANVLLQRAEAFEAFMGRKFGTFKRYSGEGTEALLPALDFLFGHAAASGVSDAVIGMAHRGRLALLVSLLDYPARKLFWKVQGNDDFPAGVQGLDDVSSHIAASVDKTYGGAGEEARRIHLTLLHNPSHLEAVNPVAAGKARAKRDQGAPDAMCVLIHGDAAVSGQGVVAETYAMANLPGYSVRGTLHVITNNQVGFTADERVGRSSRYASDMAKVVGAPVLHVNAESMREVALAARLAVEYRQAFGKDVVLDLIGWRRHGHNEVDDPTMTNPRMYAAIKGRPSFPARYAAQLAAEGALTEAGHKALLDRLNAHLEAEFAAAKAFNAEGGSLGAGDAAAPAGSGKHVVGDGTSFGGKWAGMRQAAPGELSASPATGVAPDTLRHVGEASVKTLPGFQVHTRLARSHVQARLDVLGHGKDAGAWTPATPSVDWATAEALAFGSLLLEGHDVRLTGQDVQRGTFSQRHAVLTHQATGEPYTPLNHIVSDQTGKLAVYSSLLSEMAVLGFELGYSWESPNPLVLWEAQFGDFHNGASIIIDTFITSGETKWLRQSGLVMLLPHGYDGAGPEHSSARIERFLQMVNSQAWARGAPCVDPAGAASLVPGYSDKSMTEALNFIVANPTTPANYFHLLRRQIHRPWRKPLVVFSPKTLLRHADAVSALTDMAPGTGFQPWLADPAAPAAADVDRVLLCSGKIYYELAKRRAELKGEGAGGRTALVRVEELAPFPAGAIAAHVKATYPRAARVSWVQEEPANMGAWTWAEAHLTPALAAAGLPGVEYIGRPALAAPAVGMGKRNKAQQDFLLQAALPAKL